MSKILAVTTTYNEQSTIGDHVRNLITLGYDTLIVDDSSTDKTRSIAKSAGAIVIKTKQRIGIQPCLIIAYKYAVTAEYDAVIQLDAGGSHSPDNIAAMIDALSNADVVVGSRYITGSSYDGRPARRLMSRAAAIACNVAYRHGVHISDWTSGFRAFSSRAFVCLLTQQYHSRMHGFQIESLAHALRCGLVVAEAPINYIAGRSSFNNKVAIEAIKVWLRILTGQL